MAFDFTAATHELIGDIVATCPELRHIDASRLAVAFSQARSARLDGVHAAIHPLRFPGGARELTKGSATYAMPEVVLGGREMLYVISFRLPRYLNLPFGEKMSTIIHELYHVSPGFDGSLRRFAGGNPHHTASKRRYDAVMGKIARDYLARTQRPELHAFLRHSFRELADAHGGIVGLRLRGLDPRRIA